MELSKELIDSAKLTPEQITAVTEYGKTVIATEKTKVEDEWKTKAHDNAQGILSGAATSIEKVTGVKRKDGEKIAEFIERSSTEFNSSKQSELAKLKSDYEEKIKGVKDAGSLKEEYEKMQAEKDGLLKKYADYDTLAERAKKADEFEGQLSGLKLEVAFTNSKPVFPETVNSFEAKARWDEFKTKVLATNNIEIVDGEPVAVDKENKFKTSKLSELVAKDEILQGLLKGRQQQGLNAKQVDKQSIEGVPFDVPVKADNKQISEVIKDYLTKQGIKITDKAYAQEFAKYTTLIKQQQTA